MKSVRQLLASKPNVLWFIHPEATVFDGITMLAEKNVGALPVMKDGRLVGMFSERDYARKVAIRAKSSLETPVSEIMTTQVVCATLDQTNEDGTCQ